MCIGGDLADKKKEGKKDPSDLLGGLEDTAMSRPGRDSS